METGTQTTPQTATPTMVQQVNAIQDSSAVAAAAPATQASPVAPEVQPSQQAPQTPAAPEVDSAAKLAEAEKRIRDTQAWGHQKAQEAATLRSQLTALFNDPKYRPVQGDGRTQAPASQADQTEDLEMKRAWLEYQASPNDEVAFQKLIKLAEDRASRKTMDQVQTVLQRREAEAAIKQRNLAAAETINRTVSDLAPDVPLELFWAMAGRAELETPAEITDYGQRLEWQVERAVALSRGAIQSRLAQVEKNRQQQQVVQQQAAAIMPSGGAAPVTASGAQAPARYPTMVESIRARQEALYARH